MAELKRILIEVLVVAVLGLVVGLTANAMNPDGLSVGRDYFRTGTPRGGNGAVYNPGTQPAQDRSSVPPPGTQAAADGAGPGTPPGTDSGTSASQGSAAATSGTSDTASGAGHSSDEVAEALKAWGLQPIHFDEVKPLYEDLLYEAGVFIIIDARDQTHYKAGHIPGAHQLDYYFIDRYIDQVLPLAQGAEKVVVYCNGGDCEDSRLVADALIREHGMDPMRLFVYVGGMEEWKARDMPVEKGARGSGDITGGAK